MSRRNMLAALGLAGAARGDSAGASACGVGGKTNAPNGAGEVSGGFDWKKASGSTINILQTPHPYQKSYQPLLKEFTELTGINVNADLVPEADYFTKLNTELAGGSGKHDAFMLGAYFIWQYGPAGWIENLDPWLQNSVGHRTGLRLRGHLRRAAHLDAMGLHHRQPAGHRWAVGDPVGFREQRRRLQQEVLRPAGYQEAALTGSTTSSSWPSTSPTARQNRYGIATRGSKSWATIHPGFMTQYTREGAVDYTFNGSDLIAEMDSDKAIAFTEKWIEMQHKAGPTSWTSYEYPNATGDLGDGKAMMVYDADSATYPKNKPGASAAGGQPRLVRRSRRARRQLQDQPVDVELGDERQLAQQACLRGCSSSGPPARTR